MKTQNEPTQTELVLTALKSAKGKPVSLFDLYLASGSMNIKARIYDLRQMGYTITNYIEGIRPRHSFYTLVN